ncbi:MAG: pantetheine-phosphate adenylyltransferase [Phycisphaerales bacterium]|nr:pantetheine-phosphate adenylyltransferase [Phycisphaerales bacterium]
MTTTHVALYAGSFDPITFGHIDVIHRSRRLFDRVVVGVGQNPDKPFLFPIEERTEMAVALVREMVDASPEGADVEVRSYDGLTVDFARNIGATALLRGLRNATDTAAECQLAMANRQVADIETVFILPSQEFGFTSSSLIRQIVALGGDVDALNEVVPGAVIERLRHVQRDASHPIHGRSLDEAYGVD